jgi:hypothetical protein
MKRVLLIVCAVVGFVLGAHSKEAAAANTGVPCVNLSPGPASAPLTDAGLSCDANGNLLVNLSANAVYIFPYGGTYNQPTVPSSFVGIAGLNWTSPTQNQVDSLVEGPSQYIQTGTGVPFGEPGVLAVQGTGPYGVLPVEFNAPFNSTMAGQSTSSQLTNIGTAFIMGGMYTTSAISLTNNQFNPIALDSSGNVKINCATGCGGSTTFPYSGTSSGQTATTASVLGAGGFYNTALPTISNTQFSPFQVDSSGRLIINCSTGCSGSSTFPYGTGAAQTGTANSFLGTAYWDGAHVQPGLADTSGRAVTVGAGTAGTPVGGVVSVQGVASGTAVPVSGTFWQTTQPVSGTVTANAGTGNFNVIGTGTAGTPATGVVSIQGIASGTTVPVTATQSGTWNIGTITTLPSLVAGSANIGHIDGQGTAGTPSGGVVTVQGIASGTAQPVSGTVAATQSGTWNINTITTLPALVGGSAIIGKVGIDQTTPGTTNGVALSGNPCSSGTLLYGSASTSTSATALFNLSSGKKIYVCNILVKETGTGSTFTLYSSATAANACTVVDQTFVQAASLAQAGDGWTQGPGTNPLYVTNASDSLCFNLGSAQTVSVSVTVVQQ